MAKEDYGVTLRVIAYATATGSTLGHYTLTCNEEGTILVKDEMNTEPCIAAHIRLVNGLRQAQQTQANIEAARTVAASLSPAPASEPVTLDMNRLFRAPVAPAAAPPPVAPAPAASSFFTAETVIPAAPPLVAPPVAPPAAPPVIDPKVAELEAQVQRQAEQSAAIARKLDALLAKLGGE